MADANVALTTFTTSAITVAAINWLKQSPWFPWITKEKIVLLRVLSALAATAGSVGIQHAWNGATHELVISGLTAANIVAFCWAIVKQFSMNETIFQMTKSKNGAPAAPVVPAAPIPPQAPAPAA